VTTALILMFILVGAVIAAAVTIERGWWD